MSDSERIKKLEHALSCTQTALSRLMACGREDAHAWNHALLTLGGNCVEFPELKLPLDESFRRQAIQFAESARRVGANRKAASVEE